MPGDEDFYRAIVPGDRVVVSFYAVVQDRLMLVTTIRWFQ